MRTLLLGLAAGAAGKAALDVASYSDMLLRGRPASDVPAKVVDRALRATNDAISATLEDTAAGLPIDDAADDDGPGPRASATGALAGLAIGLGLGAGYALLRTRVPASSTLPRLVAGAALSAAAMAMSDVPTVTTGATTDPREWSVRAWLSDVLPHAAYGFTTVATYELMRRDEH